MTDEKTTDHVRIEIKEIEGFGNNQLLICNATSFQTFLSFRIRLYEQKVVNGVSLQLIEPTLDHSNISVDVATLEGKMINLKMKADSGISDVKQKIKNMESITQDQVCLFFEDRPLEDCYTLVDYNIRNGSKLHLSYFRGL
ncbi:hypothetical protein WR25_07650 [Diploscapter pachys]|uniref:Ubiquitin-like domain-containing protein n=1 Tax=Diploscapter pachys TaxID=2018661 RepID=A0A2A2LVM4_9BILA|nr:hypothetical protein WR25_07650 [Diploscapter pachys]